MNEALRRRLILLLLLEESVMEKISQLLLQWSMQTSPLTRYRSLRQATLERIRADRRIGISQYVTNVIPRYGGLQFQEHFRMSSATFQV